VPKNLKSVIAVKKMEKEKMNEKSSEEIKIQIFLEKLSKEYPVTYNSIIKIHRKAGEIWKNISPKIGEESKGYFIFDKKGLLKGNLVFWIFVCGLSEFINSIAQEALMKKDFEKYKKRVLTEAKKVAALTAEEISSKTLFKIEIESIECKKCGTSNEFDARYCKKCGTELKNSQR